MTKHSFVLSQDEKATKRTRSSCIVRRYLLDAFAESWTREIVFTTINFSRQSSHPLASNHVWGNNVLIGRQRNITRKDHLFVGLCHLASNKGTIWDTRQSAREATYRFLHCAPIFTREQKSLTQNCTIPALQFEDSLKSLVRRQTLIPNWKSWTSALLLS